MSETIRAALLLPEDAPSSDVVAAIDALRLRAERAEASLGLVTRAYWLVRDRNDALVAELDRMWQVLIDPSWPLERQVEASDELARRAA